MRISDWSSDVCSSDLTFPNRKTVEDEIARLIALLDALDGDPDLEECSDREQDDCDDPAWLERINQTGAPCPANMWWGYRDSEDEERDEAYYGLCLHYGVDQNAPASETNPDRKSTRLNSSH